MVVGSNSIHAGPGARWRHEHAYLLLAAIASVLFVLVRPAVADLQAADARAAAAARGVGLSYWLSWFGGSSPGDYSILSPTICSVLGTGLTVALATMVIAVTARPLLAGTARPRSGVYVTIGCAIANLWSGRVAFALGAALAMLALLALRRAKPWLAGALNAIAALASPLAAAFLLLGLSGVLLRLPSWRARLLPFAGLSAVGLAVPAVAFGVPGAMPYPMTVLVWTLLILATACVLPMPASVRIGIGIAFLAAVLCYLVPNGIGANMQRYAYLVIPPLVWSQARGRSLTIVLALAPAIAYGGYNLTNDLVAARQGEAQAGFYAPLRAELLAQPALDNHRVEVIDTPTHRDDTALVPAVFLARGWDVQNDTSANPILYARQRLTPTNYRTFLDDAAVAWIAVPDRPLASQSAEAALATSGVPYLSEIWHNSGWRLYAVARPTPIVDPLARVDVATESSLVITLSRAAMITIRIHPSRYLQLTGGPPTGIDLCVTPDGNSAIRIDLPAAGTYRIDAQFSIPRMIGADRC